VYENREDGSGSDCGGGGGKLAASSGQTFTRIFISNFLGWAFLFWSWEGGCVAVCDGSLRVPRCGGCASLRVGRTLFSHTSHLRFPPSLSKYCEVCLCLCRCVCVHPPPPPPPQIGSGVAFFPNSSLTTLSDTRLTTKNLTQSTQYSSNIDRLRLHSHNSTSFDLLCMQHTLGQNLPRHTGIPSLLVLLLLITADCSTLHFIAHLSSAYYTVPRSVASGQADKPTIVFCPCAT